MPDHTQSCAVLWRAALGHAVARIDARVGKIENERGKIRNGGVRLSMTDQAIVTELRAVADDLWKLRELAPENYEAAMAIWKRKFRKEGSDA